MYISGTRVRGRTGVWGLLFTAGSAAAVQPSVVIHSNGVVINSPAYPYLGHKYHYDRAPGDNDMPWLRNFADSHDVFDDVDMDTDWKDREFDMMKAIVRWTSENMTWTGTSTVPTGYRAKNTLVEVDAHPEYVWGCGQVSAVAIGLGQAHGIPGRFVNSRTSYSPYGADYCMEFYSTRYNRWVWFCPKTHAWIEREGDGPLGVREIMAHSAVTPIMAVRTNDIWTAVPNPPLVFMPSSVNRAPIAPFYSIKWWALAWTDQRVDYRFQPNGNGNCCDMPRILGVASTANYNAVAGTSCPVVSFQSTDINYPLNNVEASTALADDGSVLLTLCNNMFEFTGYEMKVAGVDADDAEWRPLDLPLVSASPETYRWQPGKSAVLFIRGRTIAGVHSPDVVLEYTQGNPDDDMDGIPNAVDACPNGPPGVPVRPDGRPRSDLNDDCAVDALDIQLLVNDAIGVVP